MQQSAYPSWICIWIWHRFWCRAAIHIAELSAQHPGIIAAPARGAHQPPLAIQCQLHYSMFPLGQPVLQTQDRSRQNRYMPEMGMTISNQHPWIGCETLQKLIGFFPESVSWIFPSTQCYFGRHMPRQAICHSNLWHPVADLCKLGKYKLDEWAIVLMIPCCNNQTLTSEVISTQSFQSFDLSYI